jgi:ABC-type bacteriocin/lantibiotic exporter with double-glycine peptidase domain
MTNEKKSEEKIGLTKSLYSKIWDKVKPNQVFLERYYNFWSCIFNYKWLIKPTQIDFYKPHWQTFTKHWLALSYIIGAGLLSSIAYSSGPIIAGYVFAQRDIYLFIVLVFSYIMLNFFDFSSAYLKQAVLNNIDISIQNSATKFFLTIDPLNYATKSTGEILNKITRSTASAKSILNTFTWTLSAFGGFGTLVGSALYTDSRLFWLTVVGFSSCGLFYAFARFPFYSTFLKKNINNEDSFFAVLNETINQLAFIRSIFATPEQYKRIKKQSLIKAITASNEEAYTTLAGNLSSAILELTKIPIAVVLFERVSNGTLSSEVALGFFAVFWSNTWTTGVLAHNFQIILADWAKMADLWKYIRNLPSASFPVLNDKKIKTNTIIIKD